MTRTIWLALILILVFAFACSTDDNTPTDGDATDGDLTDGDATDGDLADGDAPDGDLVDGDATDGDADGDSEAYPFVPFSYQDGPTDVSSYRLCAEAADPAGADEKIFIDCETEGEAFAPETVEPKSELLVMSYNIERGQQLDKQLAGFAAGDIPTPDVLMLIESDRGCSRSGTRNVAREIAEQLQMNYIYAVEFIELPREGGGGGEILATCEHGNALLSRYPMGNVQLIRHETQRDWTDSESEPRLGGRIAIAADIKVGDKLVHAVAVHFESDASETYRGAQALETIAHTQSIPHASIVGGDFNCGYYSIDLQFGSSGDHTMRAFLDAGFIDAHAELPIAERATKPDSGLTLDILTLNREGISHDPGMCAADVCASFSDHLPVWVTLDLE